MREKISVGRFEITIYWDDPNYTTHVVDDRTGESFRLDYSELQDLRYALKRADRQHKDDKARREWDRKK